MGRTYLMMAAQSGSTAILKDIYQKNPKVKFDLFDSLGRGIFSISKDEFTRYLLLAMMLKKTNSLNTKFSE